MRRTLSAFLLRSLQDALPSTEGLLELGCFCGVIQTEPLLLCWVQASSLPHPVQPNTPTGPVFLIPIYSDFDSRPRHSRFLLCDQIDGYLLHSPGSFARHTQCLSSHLLRSSVNLDVQRSQATWAKPHRLCLFFEISAVSVVLKKCALRRQLVQRTREVLQWDLRFLTCEMS